MTSWSAVTRTAAATRRLGRLLGERATAGMVVLLNGPLGAGKTCFAQGVAYGLGIPEQTAVTSPSYTLMNIHRGRLEMYHFDLYRLGRVDDLEDLGYDEYAEGTGLTLVEWADRLIEDLPSSLEVEISYDRSQVRTLRFSAKDEAGMQILAGMRSRWKDSTAAENL